MIPKPTIKDVAQRAGVGVGTVSRVLNNRGDIRSSTRETVLNAMQALDYTPNPHARRVAGGKSYTVSVLLPALNSEFYIRLLNGLETVFSEARYDTGIFPLLNRSRLERYLGSHTLADQADGLVMVTYNLSALHHQHRLRAQQPSVLVDAFDEGMDCVFFDNVLGGQVVGDYAAGLPGELYAVWVEMELDQLFSTRVFEERRSGFHQAVHAAGRTVKEEFTSSFDPVAARSVASALLDRVTWPCTVFASADLLAGALLDEAHARGLRVGQDLRVIGFDDQPWAASRGLTTVHQPVEQLGQEAAQLLLSRLAGFEGAPRARRFIPRLVVRQT